MRNATLTTRAGPSVVSEPREDNTEARDAEGTPRGLGLGAVDTWGDGGRAARTCVEHGVGGLGTSTCGASAPSVSFCVSQPSRLSPPALSPTSCASPTLSAHPCLFSASEQPPALCGCSLPRPLLHAVYLLSSGVQVVQTLALILRSGFEVCRKLSWWFCCVSGTRDAKETSMLFCHHGFSAAETCHVSLKPPPQNARHPGFRLNSSNLSMFKFIL